MAAMIHMRAADNDTALPARRAAGSIDTAQLVNQAA
jgi:hypothetical protein